LTPRKKLFFIQLYDDNDILTSDVLKVLRVVSQKSVLTSEDADILLKREADSNLVS
jgi:hypothetical protein